MIEHILTIALFTIGLHYLTREGELLGGWQRIAYDNDKELRSVLFEPIMECMSCMSSFWTCLYFGYNYGVDYLSIEIYSFIFLSMLLFSVLFGIKENKNLIYWYLIFVVTFLFSSTFFYQGIVCIVSVYAINFMACKVISYIDHIRNKELFL